MRLVLPLTGAVVVIVGCVLVFHLLGNPECGIDDAQIFLTYAQNIVRGHGFVYNAGGEEVEGATSLLWVLVCSGVMLASDRPEMVLLTVNVALVVLTVLGAAFCAVRSTNPSVYTSSRDHWQRPIWVVGAVVILTCVSPGFLAWTTVTLMDVGLWCFLLTAGTLAFARASVSETSCWQQVSLSTVIVASLLARPEAMLISFVWVLSLVVATYLGTGSWKVAVRRSALPAGVYVSSVLALTLFRLLYFGYPLPNTYYAKVSPDRVYNFVEGCIYVRGFMVEHPLVLLCAALGLGIVAQILVRIARQVLRRSRRPVDCESRIVPQLFVVSAVVCIGFAIPMATGGDHFGQHRFLQPLRPLVILLAILCALTLPRAVRLSRPGLTIFSFKTFVALMAVMVLPGPAKHWINFARGNSGIEWEFQIARNNLQLGNELDHLFSGARYPSIGVIGTGGVGRAYRGEVVDLMGLNSVVMGHSEGKRKGDKNHAAFNVDVFFRLAPDLVRPSLVDTDEGLPKFGDYVVEPGSFRDRALKGLEHSPRFRKLYVPVVIECPAAGMKQGRAIATWCRRAYLCELDKAGLQVVILSARKL